MSYRWGDRSRRRMEGLHPHLVQWLDRFIEVTPLDITVLEGMRSAERQARLVASGASKTMHSRHLTGHAVDIAPLVAGRVSWDWPLYHAISEAGFQAANDVRIPIEWGGNWTSFKDGPHWQLPRSVYP